MQCSVERSICNQTVTWACLQVAAISFPHLMLSIKIPGLYLGFITVSQSHRESIGYTDY